MQIIRSLKVKLVIIRLTILSRYDSNESVHSVKSDWFPSAQVPSLRHSRFTVPLVNEMKYFANDYTWTLENTIVLHTFQMRSVLWASFLKYFGTSFPYYLSRKSCWPTVYTIPYCWTWWIWIQRWMHLIYRLHNTWIILNKWQQTF